MGVPLLDLVAQYETIRAEMNTALSRVMQSQQFILGEEVAAFEGEIAAYLGTPHAVGVASGTDALELALRALGIGAGDEVLVPTFTFFATAGAVVNTGARPIFLDIEPEGFGLDPRRVEAAVTPATRALLAVHLFGQCVDLEALRAVADRHGLLLIEDAAQAIGASLGGRSAGTMASAGCFSFFPTKNLGGAGDGGLITTSDPELDAALRTLRVHGSTGDYRHTVIGTNSRLDALQAAILRAKLPHLDAWNEARRRNAGRYRERFQAAGLAAPGSGPAGAPVVLPVEQPGRLHVYHQYVIRAQRRDALQAFLHARGIGTGIYYPVALHRQECFRYLGQAQTSLAEAEAACGEVLALPIYPELSAAQQDEVVDAVARFYA